MKLLIIVLSLLSERFLIHKVAFDRFNWFEHYCQAIIAKLPNNKYFSDGYIRLIIIIISIVLPILFLTIIFSNVMFGLLGIIISFIVFYYCLGPSNPFYPEQVTTKDNLEMELAASQYFITINNQLFAVIFWFIVAGAPGALLYRLVSLCAKKPYFQAEAEEILGLLDWIPVRIVVFLWLLVGNFQQGILYYTKMFFSEWKNNNQFLSTAGLLASRINGKEVVQLSFAQNLVEQALILYLVLIALFTLIAWF